MAYTSNPRTSAHAHERARIRLPQSWRAVTSRKLREPANDRTRYPKRREVPEIRLSGAWLERLGFVKGRRYLISADREIETIYLQADVTQPRKRRRAMAGRKPA